MLQRNSADLNAEFRDGVDSIPDKESCPPIGIWIYFF